MQSIDFSGKKGITLVESIVAGTISIFVLVTAIALYKMNSDQIRDSFTRCQIRAQYQTLIDEIDRIVRQSKVILSSNAADFFETDTTANQTDVIYCMGDSGTTLGAFRRNGTAIEELKGSFTGFKVGSAALAVADCGSGNTFSIAGNRKSVTLNLSVFGVNGSFKDTVYSKRETFTCRN
jgi:type II secretory pathway pseudopilin PulG